MKNLLDKELKDLAQKISIHKPGSAQYKKAMKQLDDLLGMKSELTPEGECYGHEEREPETD